MPSPASLLGAAGEHYVMCQLLRQNLIAALAPAGVPNADIVVTDRIGARLCAIQVKTRRDIGADRGWHMSKKHEDLVSPTLFYCFVDFGQTPDAVPTSWIVPSERVSQALKRSHQAWLARPGKKGQPHNDNDLRRFLPNYGHVCDDVDLQEGWLDRFREAWAVLGKQASND